MDLLSIGQQEKKVSLLTLPRSDLIVKAKHGSSNADEDKAATARNNQENESPSKKPTTNKQLVLMQLPKGMSMSELASGCHFVAPRANDSNKKSPAARQASLVVESKQQSYSVSRLETSNVLILVPPAQDTTRTVPIQNSTTTKQPQENNGPSPSKKPKVSASDTSRSSTSSLLPVSARLLQPGGSGASFLELRRKMLRPGDLLALLQKHLFDPYNNSDADKRNAITNPYSNSNNKTSTSNKPLGRTVDSLARELQCSQGQVKMALPMVQGFLIPSNATNTDDAIPRYGLLSEEALREAQNGIIATLAESDDFGDYAFKGVDLEAFLPQVVERFSSSQSYPALEHVIRFALTTLIQTNYSRDEMLLQVPATGTVQLDVKKIALCLAHRLFQSQTAPWEESRFCLRWQSELPGVGSVYQTSLDMLRGVAIPVDASNTPRKAQLLNSSDNPASSDAGDSHSGNFWKYFSANKLPLQPEERFQALFKVKGQWTLKELEPYLESLVQETNLTQAELLLQYTTNNPGVDKDGKATKVYSFKR